MSVLVSIISPCYNNEKFIEQTIQSVLSQTYSNWEMLIVDDCSTDKSYAIAQEYSKKDSRIKVFKNEYNRGPAYSRNVALNNAKGKYIAFLDTDDLWSSEKLEKQILFMETKKCFFSYTKYKLIDNRGNDLNVTVSGPKHISKRMMFRSNYVGCLTVIYDVEIIGKLEISEDIRKRNDYALWLKVIKKADCYLLDECLAYYRKGVENSISSSSFFSLLKHHFYLYRKSENFGVINSFYHVFLNLLFVFLRKKKYTQT